MAESLINSANSRQLAKGPLASWTRLEKKHVNPFDFSLKFGFLFRINQTYSILVSDKTKKNLYYCIYRCRIGECDGNFSDVGSISLDFSAVARFSWECLWHFFLVMMDMCMTISGRGGSTRLTVLSPRLLSAKMTRRHRINLCFWSCYTLHVENRVGVGGERGREKWSRERREPLIDIFVFPFLKAFFWALVIIHQSPEVSKETRDGKC